MAVTADERGQADHDHACDARNVRGERGWSRNRRVERIGRRAPEDPATASSRSRRPRYAKRDVGGRAPFDGRRQQSPRIRHLAAVKRRGAAMQQLFALPLPLGQRAPRAIDVGAGPRMAAVEKEDARPDVDRVLVTAGEVVVEPVRSSCSTRASRWCPASASAAGRSVRAGSDIPDEGD